ncbi:MAG: hypothetical protein J7M29_01150, partial [Verrucomicrobia bacterium]|nr:hypothetical protein [Verrucomicrobiota bacterium]
MLQGLHGENKADTFGLDAEGFMDWFDVIDFATGSLGNFSVDYLFSEVGIPGPDMPDTDNCALEIIGYIEFPEAGMYTMGATTDDGFRVQAHANPRDLFAVRVGEFEGSRGVADTLFKIYVPEPGIYPFRMIWENGGGGAAVEWFMVQDDGTMILLNDPLTPGSLNVYPRAASTPPYVKLVTPAIDATGVRADTPIEEVIAEGDTGQVDQGSVAMTFNGEAVTPDVSRSGNEVTIAYQPPEILPPGSTNTVSVTWQIQGGEPRTDTWSFVVADYTIVPTDLASPIGTENADEPGFLVKTVQLDAVNNNMPGNLEFAEAILVGALRYDGYLDGTLDTLNIADLSAFGPDGYYVETDTINYAETAGQNNGNFTPDRQHPGIPGLTDSADNYASEFKTYVVFPEAGVYEMGVNSDDGFRVTVAEGPTRQLLEVEAPAAIAGPVAAVPASVGVSGAQFGGPIPATPIEGEVALVGEACDPLTMDLTGKVALIDRGTCAFVDKARNAQAAGAIAAIIAMNETTPDDIPFVMGGTAEDIAIPVVMISYEDGRRLKDNADGLRVSIGADASPNLGEFNNGRGASDTLFSFYIQEAGVYPFRCLYEQGGGGGNVEWFSVTKDGKKVLLNDATDADALKCYRSRT